MCSSPCCPRSWPAPTTTPCSPRSWAAPTPTTPPTARSPTPTRPHPTIPHPATNPGPATRTRPTGPAHPARRRRRQPGRPSPSSGAAGKAAGAGRDAGTEAAEDEQEAEARAADEVEEVAFEPEQTRRRQGPRQARLELRVGLATLLGLDDQPRPAAGLGRRARRTRPPHRPRPHRRRMARRHHRRTGALTAALVTRRRPHGYRTTPRTPPPAEPDTGERFVARPVVELHATEEFLDALDPAAHPAWTRVIADLQHQLALWRAARAHSHTTIADDPAAWRDSPRPVPHRRPGPLDRDARPQLRVPHLRRHRDRLRPRPHPGLHRRRRTHRRRQPRPALPHDHHAKHDGGWQLAQPCPGCFTWTSPTGHTYDPRPAESPARPARTQTTPRRAALEHRTHRLRRRPPRPRLGQRALPRTTPRTAADLQPPPASTPDDDDPPF